MHPQLQFKVQKAFNVWGIILILWSLYRVYGPRLPETIDELIMKPLIFLGPVILVLGQEKKPLASVGIARGHFWKDVYMGLGLGLLFIFEGIVTNSLKYGGLRIMPQIPISQLALITTLIVVLATGISEEVLVRGFLYTRLKEGYGWVKAMLISTAMYFMLLVPYIFVISKLNGITLFVFVLTTVMISFVNTMIFNETKTITVPVLVHAFWNMAVVLYL